MEKYFFRIYNRPEKLKIISKYVMYLLLLITYVIINTGGITMLKRLKKARVRVLVKYPFFGSLLMYLKLVEQKEIGTAGTDGTRIFYNPEYISTLTDKELNWLVIHEVLHPVLGHMHRIGNRRQDVWNEACDYAVHSIMHELDQAIISMPAGGLYDSKYNGMSAEAIYSELIKNKSKGNTLDNHGKWSKDKKNAEKWDDIVKTAAKTSDFSKTGNTLSRILGNLIKPKTNWRSLLSSFIQPVTADYSFTPPSKYYSHTDFFLPDLNDEDGVKDILIYNDTSGSVDDKSLGIIYSEIVSMVEQFSNNIEGHVGFFDHEAYPPVPFSSVSDILSLKPLGGGGTAYEPIFDEMKKLSNVKALIIITDGECSFPPEDIAEGVPVLWLIVGTDIVPPWGIYAKVEETECA